MVAEAGLTGAAVGVGIWILAINHVSTLWIAGLLCLIAGLFATIPGAAAVKCYRWLRDRVFG